MRITVTIEDRLLAAAQAASGVSDPSALVQAALKALVERAAAATLIGLGGTEPDLRAPPRRR